MKKFFLTLVVLLTTLVSANAMSYEQARDQALFLTDKMAYELNLNEQQYEAAYEINLDYLMGVTTVDDVYAHSWRQRNLDMQYILLDWQFSAFCAATYFYRPLYWNAGCWHFGIYAHYPHRDFFYYSRPACYVSYRGGHSWRYNGGRSWYVERTVVYRGSGNMHHGMREVHGITVDRSYRSGSNRGSAYRGTSSYTEHRGNATERRGNSFSNNRGTASNVRENGNATTSSYNRGNRDNASTSSYNRGNRDNATTSSYNRGNRDNTSSSSFGRGSSTRQTVDRQSGNSFSGNRSSLGGGTSVSHGNSSMSRNAGSSFSRGGGSVSHGGGSVSHGGGSVSRGGGVSHSGGAGVSRGGGFSGGGHGGRR